VGAPEFGKGQTEAMGMAPAPTPQGAGVTYAGGRVASEVDFRRQLAEFIKALIALSPSRNYVVQFLYLLKMNRGGIDYRILEESYPEIVKDEYVRDYFAKAFGVRFAEKVSLELNTYGYLLTDFVTKVIELFENPEFRAKISSIVGEYFPEGIPNLAKEWLEVRLEGLKSEPTYGKNSIAILKELVKTGRMKPEEIEKRLNLSRGHILNCLNLLELYGLVEKDYDGSYKPAEPLRKYQEVLGRF